LPRTVSREDISLAINSAEGRSQNQFHIHIDCFRPDVRSSLERQRADIGQSWKPLAERLAGHQYIGMRVVGSSLGVNPFRLLASRIPGARARMGTYSLFVVADHGSFLILAEHAAGGNHASGEELQDHACAVAGDRDP